MPPELIKALAKALGLAETATEAQVKKALRTLGLTPASDLAIVQAVAGALRARERKPGRMLGKGEWWQLRAAGNDVVELLIYGDIGENWMHDGITAKDLVEQLQKIEAATINVRINSFGGSVSDGIAIYNALTRHEADVVVDIDGVAISIASLIAMAGDPVRMADNAQFMVHAPWGAVMGNAPQMREYADVLERFADAMTSAYARKTGKADEVRALLKDGVDHWYSPEQAKAFGFVDEITPSLAAAASFNPSRFRVPTAAAVIPLKESPMNFRALAAALGIRIAANATDAQIRALVLKELKLADAATDAEITAALEARIPPAAEQEPSEAPAQIRTRVMAELQARNSEIRQVFAAFRTRNGVAELEVECLAEAGMTAAKARDKLLAHLGEGSQPLNPGQPRVSSGQGEREKFIEGASQALAVRAGLEKRDDKNEFNGMSLPRMAENCLIRAGVPIRGMSNDAIARKILASMTTTDFPNLLSSVATKALRKAYDEAPSTYQLWAGVGEVSDFKASPRIQLGSFNNLSTKLEGEDYSVGSVTEDAETITAATKGKMIKLSREMIVNDDLGAFTKRAVMLGRAAKRTINSDVYALLTSGAGNDGPTMSDTGQLFNTTAVTTAGGHANKSGTSDAVTVASIAAGRAAMRKQKDKSLQAILNIMPRYLIAPVGKEDVIWAVLNSTSDPSSSNSAKRNYVRDVAQLVLVTDPLLDAVSSTAWFLAADPNDTAALIEVDFLDGVQTPYIDEAIDFDSDALKMKVRLDYGLAAIEWRAGYKNPGA